MCRGDLRSPAFVRLNDFTKTKLTTSITGRRGRRPLQLFGQVSAAAKSLRSLRIYILLRDRESGADFALRYHFVIEHNFHELFILQSAPCRLTPNEALPQTPQGTLSLDPASPLTPGLSLRFTSRSARCWLPHSGRLCQFLIPHSSFLIPHSSLLTPHSSFLPLFSTTPTPR